MKIQKAELAQKIGKLKGIVPKKTMTPILQGILVKDGYLIASNTEMTVKTKLEGIEDECFIIPQKAFDLINNLPDGEIEITAEKNEVITIKAKKIRNKYQTMNPELFPANKAIEENEAFTIRSEMLFESMKKILYSIQSSIQSQTNNRIMTTMCLQAAEGILNFVGTDGHVLAWDKVDYEGEFTLLIPKTTVEKMLSLGISGEISIRNNENSAVFITDDYEIYTQLFAGKYYSYQQMFTGLPLHTAINRTEFLEAMTRAKACTDEKTTVRFELSGMALSISVKDSTTDYQETITLQEPLEQDVVIGFNVNLVIETLKAFDCENVGIQLAGGRQPMIVEAEDNDFRALVLPIAIQ